MTQSPRRPLKAVVAVLAALVAVLVAAPPSPAAEPGTTVTPAVGAADWLATELEAKNGMLTVSFGGPEFADQGLTIDAILGIIAAGRGDDPAVGVALDALADPANLVPYITGFSTIATDRSANAVAKTLLVERIAGVDASDAYDLEADLRGLMEAAGADTGRFSDLGASNFANGIGQALAILALDRTPGGSPTAAIDYLLDQQCSDGSFRLYQFGYTLDFGPPAVTVDTHTCEDPAEGDPDATAFALMALRAVPSTPDVASAIDGAIDHLLGQQQPSGGFLGTGAVNSNTTGLAASALRAVGEEAAADAGAAFLADLQDTGCADLGSIAYDQTAFAAGIAADRGQWTRATAQGVLGLGLPDYGGIGSVAPERAGLADIGCAAAAPTPVTPKGWASVSAVTAGGSVTLSAVGFAPGEKVDVSMPSAEVALGTLTADAAGAVEGDVTVPADVEPGNHAIVMVGQTSGTEVEIPIEVLPAAVDDPTQLPATGSPSIPLASVAVALLVVGGVLVAEGRRRREVRAS
ncbi:MAG: prenyltransferase/squalene oxidase repeat-containing protein [Acidimicrobiales bacterium]